VVPVPPSLEELEQTVMRMTARYRQSPDPVLRRLIDAIGALDGRFVADLADPRDLALARASALMVARAVVENWSGQTAAGEDLPSDGPKASRKTVGP